MENQFISPSPQEKSLLGKLLPFAIGALVVILLGLIAVLVYNRRSSREGISPAKAPTERNCAAETNPVARAACYQSLGFEKHDTTACDAITDEARKKICVSLTLSAIALEKKDMSACLAIPLDQYRGCFRELLKSADAAYCGQLPDPWKEKCVSILKNKK